MGAPCKSEEERYLMHVSLFSYLRPKTYNTLLISSLKKVTSDRRSYRKTVLYKCAQHKKSLRFWGDSSKTEHRTCKNEVPGSISSTSNARTELCSWSVSLFLRNIFKVTDVLKRKEGKQGRNKKKCKKGGRGREGGRDTEGGRERGRGGGGKGFEKESHLYVTILGLATLKIVERGK